LCSEAEVIATLEETTTAVHGSSLGTAGSLPCFFILALKQHAPYTSLSIFVVSCACALLPHSQWPVHIDNASAAVAANFCDLQMQLPFSFLFVEVHPLALENAIESRTITKRC
jgi:hypothetical protein